MKHLEELKDSIKSELEKYSKQGLSSSNFERIKSLLAMYKDACKVEMYEEEAEGGYSETRGGMRMNRTMGGSSYDDGMMYSERRGRGKNAKRDSMGRYSSDGGSYEGGSSYRGGYSRDEASDFLMDGLGELMRDADPKQKELLKKWMRETRDLED
jgi:hypothetical protein